MSDTSQHWYDDEAGPLVRLFAVTAGRAKTHNETFDLMATVQASPLAGDEHALSPEQRTLLSICRRQPQTVTDVASELNLPLGVVRVLLSDLLEAGLVFVTDPVPHQLPDRSILKEVIDGLRAL